MNITRLCPKCGETKRIESIWQALFGESYLDFHAQTELFRKNQWAKELPDILNQIESLESESQRIEGELPQDKVLELKSVNQKLHFLYQRMYHNSNPPVSQITKTR